MAVVMKQLDRADEAIKSCRHLCSYDSRESVDNVLVELDQVKWASGEHESPRRVKYEHLVQVDGVNNSPTSEDGNREIVMVLAATNFSWDIDGALRLVHCLLSREELIRINLKTIEVATDVDIDEVAQRNHCLQSCFFKWHEVKDSAQGMRRNQEHA